MKIALALIFVFLITAVLISGCVQQGTPGGGAPAGGQAGGVQITGKQAEEQAFRTVDQEMEQAIGNITLEEVENELLQQG